MFVPFSVIISIVLAIIDNLIFGNSSGAAGGGPLGLLYSLAVLLPSIAVAARRLHDIGRGGWWQLIGLIPLIGWIIVIIWYATPGKAEPNQWGQNPKAVKAGADSPVTY